MITATAAFEIQNLRHVYGGSTVLDIDRMGIAAGTITGLVGPNGSGKSTLLRLLGCIERPTEGRIAYLGRPVGRHGVGGGHSPRTRVARPQRRRGTRGGGARRLVRGRADRGR